MLDLKYLTENLEEVIKKLQTRNTDFSYLNELKPLSEQRKAVIIEVEELKKQRNEASKLIGTYKRENKDPSAILSQVSTIGETIRNLDVNLSEIENKIQSILDVTPNIPHASVPVGADESFNLEVRKVGRIKKFKFTPKDHVDLAENLKIIDFEKAAKVAGARFSVLMGLGARLERALIQFMMDVHTFEGGYHEVIPPYIVNEKSMYASGQFPKFKEDAFRVDEDRSWYLNPTAEVPVINLYRDEIIKVEELPIKYVAYTTAFRSEAGSAGRDTRGYLRQHQFNKVELIKFTTPESSYAELEDMLKSSEKILKLLKIPYRVVVLSTGDMGFNAAKTYDIEVWLPGQNTYREIASISNAEDFQARRGNIRFKRDRDAKTEYVHILNGSGLAVGRTLIAIIENYQNADGTITVPEVLRPYMRVDEVK